MRSVFLSIQKPAAQFGIAAALAITAAPALHGCAGTRGAPAVERAADRGFPAEEMAEELSAIGGARVSRTGTGIQVTLDSDALFGADSAMLLLETETTIEEIARVVSRYPAARIVVTAHTDSIGPPDYRRKMTERQALSIAELLADAGVPPARIETAGFGDLEPAAPNATPEGRRANRRVTIAILPLSPPK